MAKEVSPRRHFAHAVGATILTGALTYVFLGTVSRSLDDAHFDAFSVFWSVSLIIGFGLFLPVEQELSRLGGSGRDITAVGRAGVRASTEIALAGLALLGLTTPVMLALGVPAEVVWVAAAFIVVSGLQFSVRGLLLARNRLAVYANVLLLDGGLRVALALVAALIVALGVLPGTGVLFAAALMIAILLAHAPFLGPAFRGGVDPALTAAVRAATGALVVGTLASQVLLNAGPIVIDAAGVGTGAAGAFQATFSVARIPLFVLVPLQGLLVAPLAALVAAGRTDRMTGLMSRIAAAIAGLALLGAAAGWLLGPWIIELVFGAGRSLEGYQVALLIAGVMVHAGLVISVQAIVAAERHRRSTVAWVAAVLAFALFVALLWVPLGAVDAVVVAFLVGSLTGWAVALVELRAIGRAQRSPGAGRGE